MKTYFWMNSSCSSYKYRYWLAYTLVGVFMRNADVLGTD